MRVADGKFMFQANAKSQQHPKDFPGGHPPQYYPGLALLNFGVRMGSGVFKAVWPLTKVISVKCSARRYMVYQDQTLTLTLTLNLNLNLNLNLTLTLTQS